MHFACGEMHEINTVFVSFVYFVCFASQNTILSQPSADSPFAKGAFYCVGKTRFCVFHINKQIHLEVKIHG